VHLVVDMLLVLQVLQAVTLAVWVPLELLALLAQQEP